MIRSFLRCTCGFEFNEKPSLANRIEPVKTELTDKVEQQTIENKKRISVKRIITALILFFVLGGLMNVFIDNLVDYQLEKNSPKSSQMWPQAADTSRPKSPLQITTGIIGLSMVAVLMVSVCVVLVVMVKSVGNWRLWVGNLLSILGASSVFMHLTTHYSNSDSASFLAWKLAQSNAQLRVGLMFLVAGFALIGYNFLFSNAENKRKATK